MKMALLKFLRVSQLLFFDFNGERHGDLCPHLLNITYFQII